VAIAFFDLDRTLIARNSGVAWIRRELALGHIGLGTAMRAMTWIARYHVGLADLDGSLRTAIGSLAGTDSAPIIERTNTFYDELARHWTRPGAHTALARHRAQGDTLLLLTSSSSYLSARFVADLDLAGALCNTFEIDATGRLTGRTVGPLCFGPGKLEHARAYALQAAVELENCTFYTDSYSDLAVLEKVGAPVAVNPDPRLRRHALRRGWAIEDWGEPG